MKVEFEKAQMESHNVLHKYPDLVLEMKVKMLIVHHKCIQGSVSVAIGLSKFSYQQIYIVTI